MSDLFCKIFKKEKHDKYRVIYGTEMTEQELRKVFDIDLLVYAGELQGIYENMRARFLYNRDTFICVMDGKKMAGYLNVFPVGEALHEELLAPDKTRIRDDDITPAEMAQYSPEKENNLFVISVAVHPEYRGGEVTKLLGRSFAAFIAKKDGEGYRIGDISGAAVSDGGRRFLSRSHFVPTKSLDEGYELYVCSGDNLKELICDGKQ